MNVKALILQKLVDKLKGENDGVDDE